MLQIGWRADIELFCVGGFLGKGWLQNRFSSKSYRVVCSPDDHPSSISFRLCSKVSKVSRIKVDRDTSYPG